MEFLKITNQNKFFMVFVIYIISITQMELLKLSLDKSLITIEKNMSLTSKNKENNSLKVTNKENLRTHEKKASVKSKTSKSENASDSSSSEELLSNSNSNSKEINPFDEIRNENIAVADKITHYFLHLNHIDDSGNPEKEETNNKNPKAKNNQNDDKEKFDGSDSELESIQGEIQNSGYNTYEKLIDILNNKPQLVFNNIKTAFPTDKIDFPRFISKDYLSSEEYMQKYGNDPANSNDNGFYFNYDNNPLSNNNANPQANLTNFSNPNIQQSDPNFLEKGGFSNNRINLLPERGNYLNSGNDLNGDNNTPLVQNPYTQNYIESPGLNSGVNNGLNSNSNNGNGPLL